MTDAPRASVAVWPRPVRRSPPEQAKATGKWRDNIRRGGSRAHQSEQRETCGISPAACRHHELPEAATQGPWVRTYSWRWPGWVRGREQSLQEPLGSCADSWVRTIISNPSEARRLQSAGGPDSTRGRVLILPLCFWRISRSGGRES